MTQIGKELGNVLLEEGLVTEEQLKSATEQEARTGKSAWTILLAGGVITERDLVRARALQIGMEFVDVNVEKPSTEALEAVPSEVATRHKALPMRVQEDALVVAMAEPRDHDAVGELARVSHRQVWAAAAYAPDLSSALDRAYGHAHGNGNSNGATSIAPGDIAMVEAPDHDDVETAGTEGKEPDLSELLDIVIEQDASDLHLTTGVPPTIRLHGELKPIKGYRRLMPKEIHEIVYAMLTQRQREAFEDRLELDFSHSMPGKARFRVNVFQQRDAVGAVMRLIPFDIRTVDELGLPAVAKEFARLRRGLVLVTGVTGSGKSTTLAALLDVVNTERSDHIMTVEDPIEFLHRHKRGIVNQREVGTDTRSFADALRHVLRQDPDVILVGEMRDLETISTALTAAETGHLVFATLHTQDAPQSVDRIIDVFPPHQQQQVRVQLAGSLAGVVSQQLLPTVAGDGRVVSSEVLVATPAIRNLIREGKTHQIYTSMQSGGKFGMQVMDQSLAELVKAGKVTYDIALERAHHLEEFNRLAGRD